MQPIPLASFPELHTANLRLRQLQDSDASSLFQIFSNEAVTRYYELEPLPSVQSALALISSENARYEKGVAIRWGISQTSNDNVIGTCGLKFDREHHSADLGYDLAKPYWGLGIMSEALGIVLPFSFKTLKLNRLQALVLIENLPSIRLLEKLHFAREGTFRQVAYFKGQYHDMECYSLIKEDWA